MQEGKVSRFSPLGHYYAPPLIIVIVIIIVVIIVIDIITIIVVTFLEHFDQEQTFDHHLQHLQMHSASSNLVDWLEVSVLLNALPRKPQIITFQI